MESYRRGDRVALVDAVPHRPRLRPGLEGVVLVGDEAADWEPWALVSVEFAVLGTRVWALHRRHLRLVERRPAPADLVADDEAVPA
jgi:hypothetical protein